MRTRESVWQQSFPPFPQIQLHIPCPPSSIFVPRSWAAQGRWGPDAVSGSIIRAEGDLVSMIYSCGRLHVPCHSTQLQSDVSTFTGWIWNSAYYWWWIINLCLILLISVVKVPTNFCPNFFWKLNVAWYPNYHKVTDCNLMLWRSRGFFSWLKSTWLCMVCCYSKKKWKKDSQAKSSEQALLGHITLFR